MVNFAAESHVDRSILGAAEFVRTNVLGTLNLLDASRKIRNLRFVQISTDEVYGSLGASGVFAETTPLAPNSPYAASKASADLLVRSYNHTYGFPAMITRCSNNYGPYQLPEKLIPLLIANALAGMPLPLYGDGLYVRDWIHVQDHCKAVDRVLHHGRSGEIYNIGAHQESTNLDLARAVLKYLDKSESLITFVKDRPGHDRRYAIDSSKLERELGWKPAITLHEGLHDTIDWYCRNTTWVEHVRSGSLSHLLRSNVPSAATDSLRTVMTVVRGGMKILIAGSHGMLGTDLMEEMRLHHQVEGLGKGDLDIRDADQCMRRVADLRPDILINAAAMTNVDGCELEVGGSLPGQWRGERKSCRRRRRRQFAAGLLQHGLCL